MPRSQGPPAGKRSWNSAPTLVDCRGDCRADGCANAASVRAGAHHCVNDRIEHAAERTPPTGMGCGHDAYTGIRKQDRRTICRQYSDAQPGYGGDNRVRPGRRGGIPGVVSENRVRAVDLIRGSESVSRYADRRRGARPVLGYVFAHIVLRAVSAIQAGARTCGNATLACEKSVSDSGHPG